MRFFNLVGAILCGILATGCATNANGPQTAGRKAAGAIKAGSRRPAPQLFVPDPALVGRVVKVNTNGHFAVLNFPLSRMPVLDQPLGVYRNGQKVGELKTTRRQLDDNVVADIVAGECQAGDEVSDR